MKFEKIKNKGQARLFESRYLEVLTKTHPLVIWGLYIPIIAYMLYYSHNTLGFEASTVALIFFGAMLCWTLFEYIMHRFAFHYVAESPRMQRFIYVMHGNHHEYPRDKQRLFMPPVPSLILASVIFSAQYLFLRNYAFMFFPGFILGYLIYGSMHYAIHAWNPPFKFMKPVWRNHHLHHYKSEDKGFGVSSSVWDYVFGTSFDLGKEKEDKEKVRELMFDK
ncbi:Fatty acid hydroxylase superfamily protein [Chitinophaga costaii]|uniref:Fatty acid hydroxylase superfamily protein n=1 Tax=Chitinophaga costaii TaxID=1335309 RepID=A0A1C4B2J9_9BACT|nr:sterol desaturase family protein [Chitinophaga costaii]PUZ26841.1 fatty acid hydroxylase [Chitinophaga costaii]SCC01039.1 Fatty acid hydroxylase superfamily protein [Chitinophaga costaii]